MIVSSVGIMIGKDRGCRSIVRQIIFLINPTAIDYHMVMIKKMVVSLRQQDNQRKRC